ncbi:hypothetical protein BH24ACT26_BH24ACT26_04490 [soil metagenome]
MLEEIVVAVDDRPGVMAEIGELLGDAGVNIETVSAWAHEGRGVIHLVVDDGEEAGEILTANGFAIERSQPLLEATVDDRPGELGRYCRKLAIAGVTISTVYVSKRAGGETELIFAVDDLEEAKKV